METVLLETILVGDPLYFVLKIALSSPQIYRHSAGSYAATIEVTLLLLCLQFAVQMAKMTKI